MRSLLVAIAFVLLSSATVHAQAVPLQLPVAMRISDGSGPIDRDVAIRFSLHSAPEAGSQLWIEPAKTVTSVEGFVNHTLGLDASAPLPAGIFNGAVVYLEVVIDNVIMESRLPVRSVPYAIRAGSAGAADRATLADRATAADAVAATGSAANDRIAINAQGRVGIGAAPGASDRLTVQGNVTVAGQLVAQPRVASAVIRADFETSSTSFQAVPGSRITLTSRGNPVMLAVNANFLAREDIAGWFPQGAVTVFRNSNGAGFENLGDGTFGLQVGTDSAQRRDPMSFTWLDTTAGAGTHVYELRFKTMTAGNAVVFVGASNPAQIVAYELN